MSRGLLFVDHASALGGAERILLTLLSHFDPGRWRPYLACNSQELSDHASALGVQSDIVEMHSLRRSPRAILNWAAGVRSLAGLARRVDASLLVANTVRGALYAAPTSHLVRIPFVWYMHDFWLSESRPQNEWVDQIAKRLLCFSASAVVAISDAVADQIPCTRKVVVIHNGIDVDEFAAVDGASLLRLRQGLGSDGFLVGTVGRLRPWKGQDCFLRAMGSVAEALPAARFVVVGGALFGVSDDYPERLHRLASELGIADRVTFTGHLSDVRPALAAMDLFIHPGDPEPFGLVNLEAMAMGKPIVAFAHGALPEIVLHGETGLLVPPGDEEALADAVLDLLGDPQRRSAMGAAARQRVEEHFTSQRMAAEVDSALGAVIGANLGA
jgi:glycosyltransferase involved in cell wall biosynthesis